MAVISLMHRDISPVLCVRKKDLISNGDFFRSAIVGIGAQLTLGQDIFAQKCMYMKTWSEFGGYKSYKSLYTPRVYAPESVVFHRAAYKSPSVIAG